MNKTRDALVLGFAGVLASACAAGGRAPDAKSASAPRESTAGYAQSPAGQSQPSTASAPPGQFAPPPPPPPAKEEKKPDTAPESPSGGAQPSRNAALVRARDDFDKSQRELEVAAGDCRNACRALGSMDRAAGHICELSRGSPETNRCDDAKMKLYSARDRVKSTCGTCDGVSVDRNAPVPSTR